MDTISREDFDKKLEQLILRYLKQNPPEVRHKLVMAWNFDNSDRILDWIIDQPDTDRATALMIYWMMSPRWSKQFARREDVEESASWYLASYDFIQKLETLYVNGFYATHHIAFDPKCDWQEIDWTQEGADEIQVRDTPEIMFHALSGHKVAAPEDWTDGIPPELQQQVDQLFQRIDRNDLEAERLKFLQEMTESDPSDPFRF